MEGIMDSSKPQPIHSDAKSPLSPYRYECLHSPSAYLSSSLSTTQVSSSEAGTPLDSPGVPGLVIDPSRSVFFSTQLPKPKCSQVHPSKALFRNALAHVALDRALRPRRGSLPAFLHAFQEPIDGGYESEAESAIPLGRRRNVSNKDSGGLRRPRSFLAPMNVKAPKTSVMKGDGTKLHAGHGKKKLHTSFPAPFSPPVELPECNTSPEEESSAEPSPVRLSAIDTSLPRPRLFRSDRWQSLRASSSPKQMPVDLPVPSLSSPNLDCVSGGSSTSPGQVAPLGPEQQQQQKVDDSPPPPTAPRIGCTSHPFVSPPPMLVIPFSPRFHQPGSRLNPQSTIPIPLLVMTPANTPGATEEDEKLDDYFPSITLPSFGKAPLGHGHRRLCRRKSSISSTVLLRLRGHRLSLASRSHLMPFGSVPADDPPVPPNLKNSPYLRSPLLSSSSSSSGPKFGNFPPGGSLTPNSSMVSSAGSIASSGSSTMLSPLSSPARRARNV